MTEQDHKGDGWTEYRLLVTAMLERHEDSIAQFGDDVVAVRDNCRDLISACESKIRDLIDSKFVQLGEMHRSQVANAKRDLVDEMNKERDESAQVKVAKITSRWEFWGILIAQVSAIVLALIAIFK